MILLAGFPDIDSSPPALTDASRRTPDREGEPRNQAWTPPGGCCLRCGGLLILSYTASVERDLTGRPMKLWRCVNCGDCLDHDILANRWKGPGRRARLKNGVIEVRMPRTEEAKKNAVTVKIDRVLVS